jgi:hypothetical protein
LLDGSADAVDDVEIQTTVGITGQGFTADLQ